MECRDWRFERRLRVLELYRKGWQQNRIAEALGITCGYVSQIVKQIRSVPEPEQAAVLKVRKHPGPKVRITLEHRQAILALVERGASASGFPGDAWSLKRLCHAAKQELGVNIEKSRLSEILHEAGYTCQKPETRAAERNDLAVAGFRGGGWAAIKRGL